jgi:hypothetical protein
MQKEDSGTCSVLLVAIGGTGWIVNLLDNEELKKHWIHYYLMGGQNGCDFYGCKSLGGCHIQLGKERMSYKHNYACQDHIDYFVREYAKIFRGCIRPVHVDS